MTYWVRNANIVEKRGSEVNWEEEFYICPDCGEPVYSDDWDDSDLRDNVCPICGLDKEDLD